MGQKLSLVTEILPGGKWDLSTGNLETFRVIWMHCNKCIHLFYLTVQCCCIMGLGYVTYIHWNFTSISTLSQFLKSFFVKSSKYLVLVEFSLMNLVAWMWQHAIILCFRLMWDPDTENYQGILTNHKWE